MTEQHDHETNEAGPLAGVVVADFTTHLPGPMATQKLAWMGATVIKIEPPHGDATRHAYGGHMFALTNAGKLATTLDLRETEDRNTADHLCRTADVVIEGFRPGVAERLGIGFEYVKGVNPDVVYCSMPGYPSDSARAQHPSHDLTILAESSAIALPGTWREREADVPSRPSLPVVDIAAAEAAVQAILAALVGRQRGYEPHRLEISLSEPIQYWAAVRGTSLEASEVDHWPPYLDPANDLYRCGDGDWIAIAAIEQKFWAQLCRALSLDEAWPDSDIAVWDWRLRQQNGALLQQQIETWMAQYPRPNVLSKLDEAGIPAAPVLEPSAVFHARSADELARRPPAYFNRRTTTLSPPPRTNEHADLVRRIQHDPHRHLETPNE